MKRYVIVVIVLLIASSCSHRYKTCPTYAKDKRTTEYWANTTNSEDQGKLTRRVKKFTENMLCCTFPDKTIVQKSTIASQKNWKPTLEK